MMMLQCWESVPDERPSFEILYKNTSKYIEGIAGYLEISINPFVGHDLTKGEEMGSTVEVQDKMECRSQWSVFKTLNLSSTTM